MSWLILGAIFSPVLASVAAILGALVTGLAALVLTLIVEVRS